MERNSQRLSQMNNGRRTEDTRIEGDANRMLSDGLNIIRRHRHNPFIKSGKPDADAYIAFACEYNAFINHQPKPFRRILDQRMVL